jgi:DNA-directed RNA polymerase specialized sigma subunit
VLLDQEREIIQEAYIEHKKYWRLEEKLNLTYSRIKQIEKEAVEKMRRYIA